MGSGKSVQTDTLCRNLHGNKRVYVDYNTNAPTMQHKQHLFQQRKKENSKHSQKTNSPASDEL